MWTSATPHQPQAWTGEVQETASSHGLAEQAERHLVQAAVQGDRAAFASLYRMHVDRVYRYCYYRAGNRPDAEDLAQQTFLRAWSAIQRYQPGRGPFIAWLLTISHNVTISHYRKPQDLPMGDSRLRQIEWTDPAASLSASITRAEVHWAIQRLKPDYQQVILLRFMEDFTVSEVAMALGKTDNHVRVLQHRALARLRQVLEEARRVPEPEPQRRALLGVLQKSISAVTQVASVPSRRP